MIVVFTALFLFIMSAAMEQQPDPTVLAHLNQEAITKHIIKFVGDQSNLETKFENFIALVKLRKINKTWCALVNQEYRRLLVEEEKIVNDHFEADYVSMKDAKSISMIERSPTYTDPEAFFDVTHTFKMAETNTQDEVAVA